MDKNEDLNKNKIHLNTMKILKDNIPNPEKENYKNQNKKGPKKYIITFKNYSMDKNELKIKTNNNSNNNAASDTLDDKKILKTEIYNNKKIIMKPKYKEQEISTKQIKNSKERHNSKENFGAYILQKKIKLFSLTNSNNNKNNTYTINIKESNIGYVSSKNINHSKNMIMTETNQKELDNKIHKKNIILSVKLNNEVKKIPHKLNLIINKYNNKYNVKKNEKENLKLETKINKNREILFNPSEKNNISPNRIKTNIDIISDKEPKNKNKKENLDIKYNSYKKGKKYTNEINKFFLKENNNKIYNSHKNLVKKEITIKLSNKQIPQNKNGTNKEKLINFKKNKRPIKIDINLDNSLVKESLSSEKDMLNKKEIDILSILKEHKVTLIKKENTKELKNKKEDNLSKNMIDSKKEDDINYFNVKQHLKNINEKNEERTKKLNKNNNNLIAPLNTIETDTFRKSTKNKITKNNNHYNTLFTEILKDKASNTLKTKKKFKFIERKKNGTNKDLKIKLIESTENYYDLYNKAFNDTSSLEQKFSFKPKINKIYINYNNNTSFHKKFSNSSFKAKSKEKNEQEKLLHLSTDTNKMKSKKKILNSYDNINNKFFDNINNLKDEDDNNKNLILDLNHFIPIDQNKLIDTFSKPLFGEENNPITNK